ncbi:MAG: metal ABC transporter ATP-binding protein [Candidatus Liptonbacteria bacterium]|nr:metal ABC transporter ATP-binding protein [Candidatus Liptonbacteria bacterium]
MATKAEAQARVQSRKEKILDVRNLNVVFGDFIVLEDISFFVERGEALAIIGPNGSGKTTLFRALLSAIPYTGTVRWAPQTKIGYVPQKLDIDRQLPLTARDFLHSKARVSSAGREDVERAAASVRLEDAVLERNLGELSSGQFQRAMIAFALIGKPNVLLFDEPTASVDVAGEEEVYETLHRLQDEHGLTLLLISHDLHLVYRHANTVLCVNRKRTCFGEPVETLTPETLARLYGHHPALFHNLHHDHRR